MGDRGAFVLTGVIVVEVCLCECNFWQTGPAKIEIRPMQRHAIVMPPSRCIEIFHKGFSNISAILHSRGQVGAMQ